MVGVCYRPPNVEAQINEIFCKQLGEVSQLLALVFVWDFKLVRLLEIKYSREETV